MNNRFDLWLATSLKIQRFDLKSCKEKGLSTLKNSRRVSLQPLKRGKRRVCDIYSRPNPSLWVPRGWDRVPKDSTRYVPSLSRLSWFLKLAFVASCFMLLQLVDGVVLDGMRFSNLLLRCVQLLLRIVLVLLKIEQISFVLHQRMWLS